MYKINLGLFYLELVISTNADLISWNRGWNGLYRFSKGKQFMDRSMSSIEIPEYTHQLNIFLQKKQENWGWEKQNDGWVFEKTRRFKESGDKWFSSDFPARDKEKPKVQQKSIWPFRELQRSLSSFSTCLKMPQIKLGAKWTTRHWN